MKRVYSAMCSIVKRNLYVVVLVSLVGCASNPYRSSNKIYKTQAKQYSKLLAETPLLTATESVSEPLFWVGTTNFDMRKPNFVIIHHTAQGSCDKTLATFTRVPSKVSAHYVICRDGSVHHLLSDYLRAWQAGIAKWGTVTDLNSVSIGIELDNNGVEPFTDAQIDNLLRLLAKLKKTYNIPATNFIGHGDIAPARKVDPSYLFPWKKLAEKGFGLWYSDTTGVSVPTNFSSVDALHMMGYDVSDSSAATLAFKRHFEQDTIHSWGEAERKILYSVYRKYR